MNLMRKAIALSVTAPPLLSTTRGEQRYCFAEDFLGFSGHFPGYPILPAILQTLLAQMLAEQVIGVPLGLVSLERAKFMRQLRPGDEIHVGVECQEQGDHYRCTAQLSLEPGVAAHFTLVLEKRLE